MQRVYDLREKFVRIGYDAADRVLLEGASPGEVAYDLQGALGEWRLLIWELAGITDADYLKFVHKKHAQDHEQAKRHAELGEWPDEGEDSEDPDRR